MYDEATRASAAELLRTMSLSATSRTTGISRSTLRTWRDGSDASRRTGCHRCAGELPPAGPYAALLGLYLGDGCLSRQARLFTFRVSCDATCQAIVDDVSTLITAVRPDRKVFHVEAPGVVVVQSNWVHWPCLFPQHGPGRKHERPIVLEDWQRALVEQSPADFLRGLFHSDGCRVRNWATRDVAGRRKRYDYPRWQFVNASADIRELCCWALDLVDVAWRQSGPRTISVSTRAGVARLDALIGPKA